MATDKRLDQVSNLTDFDYALIVKGTDVAKVTKQQLAELVGNLLYGATTKETLATVVAEQIGVATSSKDGLMPSYFAFQYGSLDKNNAYDCNNALELGQRVRGLYWSHCPTGFETCYGVLETFGYQKDTWCFQIMTGISPSDASYLGRYIRHSKGSASSWSQWVSM